MTTGRAIVVLTGAGISKESGLSTFRDEDGIWARVRLEDVATPDAFARNPERVHGFYNARRRALTEATVAPNTAHLALAELERNGTTELLVVTQNIDDLHERAGSHKLIHMHGELLKMRCNLCGGVHPCHADISVRTVCPGCGKPGGLRPDVVWFGEMPRQMERIYAALGRCDMFVSIGTSGNVYPAAGFVRELASRQDVRSLELNLEPSQGASLFDEARYGPASELVPAFVRQVLAGA